MGDLILPAPLPAPFALYADDLTVGAVGAITGGAAYVSAVTVYSYMPISRMRCEFSGTPTGNCDMGIYDASAANFGPGNLLAHTGAIAAVTGLFTQNLIAAINLGPGSYWLAFLDTAADSVYRSQPLNAGGTPSQRTTSTALTVLPSSLAGAVTNNANKIAVIALRSGGWS